METKSYITTIYYNNKEITFSHLVALLILHYDTNNFYSVTHITIVTFLKSNYQAVIFVRTKNIYIFKQDADCML